MKDISQLESPINSLIFGSFIFLKFIDMTAKQLNRQLKTAWSFESSRYEALQIISSFSPFTVFLYSTFKIYHSAFKLH